MIIGYFFATLVGLSLGIMGGGGSILTVPILVYIMNIEPKLAIAMSLAIVGFTGIFGVLGHLKNKNVDFKISLSFAPFAILGTYLGTRLSLYISAPAQLILFALIMIIAAVFMFKGRSEAEEQEQKKIGILFVLQAILVGIITGVVGVGGGFLIVPALIFLTGISMKRAVGTSLFIIFINSISGFISYLDQFSFDWIFLSKFIGFSAIGVLIGSRLVEHIPQRKLKKSFAIFLIVMGIFILYKNRDAFLI